RAALHALFDAVRQKGGKQIRRTDPSAGKPAGGRIQGLSRSMSQRVFTVAPLPPEKCAYALARYSRSPDSIRDSIEWVRTHDSTKFLESFYFQYGHASIADLGHVVVCFEGISELAATEIEDEQLWDGQARSSRYQDFSRSGFVTPPEFDSAQAAAYQRAAGELLAGYNEIHAKMAEYLAGKLPKPEAMPQAAYERNIRARAFDVARYLLCFGIATGVGQVTSIRTLERQVRRLKASEYAELRGLAEEIARACASAPCIEWNAAVAEPVAPTLARHLEPDEHMRQSHADLCVWAEQNLGPHKSTAPPDAVDMMKPADAMADIVATLLYPACDWPYRELYDLVAGWTPARRNEVIELALRSRTKRDELLRGFRASPYVFDIVMDIGAYRDLHRHRRCQQFRQPYSTKLGFETPEAVVAAGLDRRYSDVLGQSRQLTQQLPALGAEYLIPFAARSRF